MSSRRANKSSATQHGTIKPRKSGASEQKLLTQLWTLTQTLLFTQRFFVPIAVVVLAFDAALTFLIIVKVPYTEIDFSTYMQQVRSFDKGERNYFKISGDTGPCVYPAGHIYVYSAISWLTQGGKDLRLAQLTFGAIYLICQTAVVETYRKARAPSLLLAFLPLSKRLHSIYALRLFNDGVAMTIMWIAIALIAHRKYSFACVATSLALSVKMNILLFIPGLAVVVYRARGLIAAALDASLIITVQAILALPFLSTFPANYFAQAFDLSRQFLFKWTVNLRFLPENVFLDRRVGLFLLFLHIALLSLFGLTRWTGLSKQGARWIRQTWKVTPGVEASSKEAVLVLLTSNLIGILCARSLHYQFYSWYAQSLPLLLWYSRLPLYTKLLLPICIEAAWNTFPSTWWSSAILCASNALLVVGLYRMGPFDGPGSSRSKQA